MSDKATLAFIQQLIARMGKSGDAAGILTLFAHMAELETRLTATRATYIDNIEGRTFNMDGRLTAARATAIDTINANAAAIRNDQIGGNYPVFGAGDFSTVFKALRLINDRMLAWTRHGAESAGTLSPAPSASYATYLDISGYAGQISNLYFVFATNGGGSGGSGHVEVKITIDGDIYTYLGITQSLGANSSGSNSVDIPGLLYVPIPFISSCKIEYRTVVESGTYSFAAGSATNVKYRYMAL